jgi:hypothetical protein
VQLEYDIEQQSSTELESMAVYVGVAESTAGFSAEAAAGIRLRWFDLISADLQAHAEQNGATYQDSLSVTAIIRQQVYKSSTADNLTDFQDQCHKRILQQVFANQIFVSWYDDPKKQRTVKAAVRSGVGTAKDSCDVEALIANAWITILRHLPTYERKSAGQESAWIRTLAHGVGRHAREKYQTRARAVVTALEKDKPNVIEACGQGTYAVHAEDKIAIGEEVEAEGGDCEY